MLRLQCVSLCLRRLLHSGTINRDLVLEQLRVCCIEDHVFDVVGKNKAKLNVDHVSMAVGMLWQFQKEKPQLLRTVDLIKSHPQFLTLRVLAENKITQMDNLMLIDTLYSFLRLNVDQHDSLIQQLVSEAWLRLNKLSMASLSKFSICLSDQHLQHSPLMGHITNIMAQKLLTIDDARILTILMISVSSLVSPSLRDALITRIDHLLDTTDPTNYNNPRRVVQFLRNIKYSHRPLLEKCNQILLINIPRMNAENISIIMGLYQSLQFNNCEFRLAAKQRLTELIDSSTDPFSFTKLFVTLAPLASPEIREGLVKHKVISAHIYFTLSKKKCILGWKILLSYCTFISQLLIQRNLHVYRPVEVARITQALFLLQYQNPELYTKLRMILTKLQTAERLDLLLEELKYVSGEWFEEMLLEDTMVTLKRMMDQINWTNVPELSLFLTRINHLSPPLMERIADVVIEDIDKFHYSATYATLLPFSVLNYDTVKADEMYEACIGHFTPHISLFDPHLLVLLAYSLAVADCFPEELIKEIFSIDFLGKLDSQLETLPDALNMRVRLRLMELNRAVCLECPEYQVPWFHERYCQRFQKKGNGSINPLQQQIHKMLGEVLGGINYVRIAVLTPYFYTVDFECILDKELKPLPYVESSALPIPSTGQVQWGDSHSNKRDELPPGAQRLAVDFLDSKSFCKNSRNMKGETLMRKRHLEILGYCVIQIPHFEWNSMELSTADAWKNYLKKKIFRECSL
uniref:RAP domain-containing protein n=1 Tax=Periophthalmus magnuspinnatus TaxID=409849 RepID=A0A3B4B503_9GOBI